MARKARVIKNEDEQTQDVEALFEDKVSAEASPIVESSPVVEVVPVVDSEVETDPVTVGAKAQSDGGDMSCQDFNSLVLKIAELEDKIVKLEIELGNFIKTRGGRVKKEKKVKCKCKGKKVILSKCKCKSKKLEK